ncbi:transposase [Bilophila wadsworthia]|uniref:transposase n=1 Tax=Bilophila wadsworthia TaxID=35833 RepID=UPI00349F0DD2
MVIADASGLPLAVHTDSARPHEVTLVQATLNEIVTMGQPRRIIGDRAYDSDPLDNALAAQGIEMIAPHRRNRKRKATQDGRPLRRYCRRWKIERLFAWLNSFKRTMARWERFFSRLIPSLHEYDGKTEPLIRSGERMTSINSIRTVRYCCPYCDLLGLRKNSPFVPRRLEPHYI